jgi:hypothetical protein
MLEYLRRKIAQWEKEPPVVKSYPLYYKEGKNLIKELENGQKWIVKLDENYKEVLVERIR